MLEYRCCLSLLPVSVLFLVSSSVAHSQANLPIRVPVASTALISQNAPDADPTSEKVKALLKAEQFEDAKKLVIQARKSATLPEQQAQLDRLESQIETEWSLSLGRSGQAKAALPHFRSTYEINRKAYPERAGIDLLHLAFAYQQVGETTTAIPLYSQAILALQQTGDRKAEANAHVNLGKAEIEVNDFDKAKTELNRALLLDRTLPDRIPEANTLIEIGDLYFNRSLYSSALTNFNQAANIFHIAGQIDREADVIVNVGSIHYELHELPSAISSYKRALAAYQGSDNVTGQANALNCIGNALNDSNDCRGAIIFLELALPLANKVQNIRIRGAILNNLGNSHHSLGELSEALSCFQQAEAVYDSLGTEPQVAANTLHNIGYTYSDLGQFEKAEEAYQKSLQLYIQLKSDRGEASIFNSLGSLSEASGVRLLESGRVTDAKPRFEKAISLFRQSLDLARKSQSVETQEDALQNIAQSLSDLKQYSKSEAVGREALDLARKVDDKDSEAQILTALALNSESQKQFDVAIREECEALQLYGVVEDRRGNANGFCNLMIFYEDRQHSGDRNLAIFYGKESIQNLQIMRSNISHMDKASQKSFLKENEVAYRTLAIILLKANRLPEAFEIWNLYKQEEYLNFSASGWPDKTLAGGLAAIKSQMTESESAADALLTRRAQENIRRSADLAHVTISRPMGSASVVSILQSKAAKASQDFLATFITMDAALNKRTAGATISKNNRVLLAECGKLQSTLSVLADRPVVLYTVLDPASNCLRLLLITPASVVARSTSLKSMDGLDSEINIFRAVLQDPNCDPRPLGKSLYDKLIAPIKPDLDRAHAQTLLVALDGNLRYLPMAALSPDGKHYLVERYRTALYTPAALASLTRAPKEHWTALAMGVSAPPPGFAPLPAVSDELKSVARVSGDPSGPNAGVFPGTRMLNAAFTKSAMLADLEHGYPLVHIASHFAFSGDEATSFLLLGDGSKLTLTDLKALPEGLFSGVDLLTLSACETATGNMSGGGDDAASANSGRDVENVAVLAQRKGAAAVLASLWSVNDASTGLLMRDFYRDRKEAGSTKAEALRQAQMALLTGSTSRPSGKQVAKRSDLLTSAPRPHAKGADAAPVFVPDPKAPWAHPYYWAPFILIGNAK